MSLLFNAMSAEYSLAKLGLVGGESVEQTLMMEKIRLRLKKKMTALISEPFPLTLSIPLPLAPCPLRLAPCL